ncbi:MAG TPA: RraA family protein [Gaiellaceae bacterium]|nr:RraA family protein [Gaiellaceae bacterium]
MPADLFDRYRTLYSSIVSDCVEALGLGPRCPREGLQPFHTEPLAVAVGRAFPFQAHRTSERVEIDMLLEAVEATPPDALVVVACDEEAHVALWGGLMTTAVLRRGGVGAVVDGGIRDLHQVLPSGFPVWALYRSPYDIRGRAEIVSYGGPVDFRGVPVEPGDLVFADANGVVVVPAAHEVAVLELAEERLGREVETDRELASGANPRDVYGRLGAF